MKFYLDTSVWGGYYDKEFAEWTIPFIDLTYGFSTIDIRTPKEVTYEK